MMDQFYTHTVAGIRFLCLKDPNHRWYGSVVTRLDKGLVANLTHPGAALLNTLVGFPLFLGE